MKINTKLNVTLSSIMALFLVVALGGYGSVKVVNIIMLGYPQVLVPAVQNYGDLRYSMQRIALAVFKKDKREITNITTEITPILKEFSETEVGVAIEDKEYVISKILEIASVMANVIEAANNEDLNFPPSETFNAALADLDNIGKDADALIEGIIEESNGFIDNLISKIVSFLIIISVIAALVSIAIGLLLTRSINQGVAELLSSLKDISNGDLQTTANEQRKDELGDIAKYFNVLAGNLKLTISQLANMMSSLADLSSGFKVSGEQFHVRAQKTSDETSQVATAMTEMAATVKEVATNAETTSEQAKDAKKEADKARTLIETSISRSKKLQQQMSSVSDQIIELKGKTESISSVIDVIRGIAEQTNLLALNAAIEAARAGEQGRGFAVVADEVRNLANRTAESTQEIVTVIHTLQGMAESTAVQISEGQSDVENNAIAISDFEETLQKIIESIGLITENNLLIATTSNEQSKVAEDINHNVIKINDLSEENVEQTEELTKETNKIDDLVLQMKELFKSFNF